MRDHARQWRPVPAPADLPEGLILFDGVCVLCSAWVRFVVARDPAGRFRFAPIQGEAGHGVARRFGINPEAPETNAVVLDGMALFKSDAALEVLRRLPGWGWVAPLRLLPRGLRDWAYDRVARNRYRLFGRSETCMAPAPDIARRLFPPPGG